MCAPASIGVKSGQARSDGKRLPIIRKEQIWTPSLAQSFSVLTPYEKARCRYGADILDLSLLVNSNTHGFTESIMSTTRDWLPSVLDRSYTSYLNYIPSRYGINDCLTKAMNCLMLQLHNTLVDEPPELTIRMYSAALHSLQCALNDPTLRQHSDTLCAAHLLSLFELLRSTTAISWSAHVKGCAMLIQSRRKRAEWDEFEKSLFLTSFEPIVTAAFVSGEHSWLGQPQWLHRLMSIAEETDTLTNRSPPVLRALAALPVQSSLYLDYQRFVPTPEFLTDQAAALELQSRAEALHADLQACIKELESTRVSTHSEMIIRRNALGATLAPALMVQRLLATTSEGWRQILKANVDRQLDQLLALRESNPYLGLFADLEGTVAQCIIATKPLFEQNVDELSPREQALASQQRFMIWTATALSDFPIQVKIMPT